MINFDVQRLPHIEFGRGSIKQLVPAIASLGHSVLLVTGGHSFESSPHWQLLIDELRHHDIEWWHCRIVAEPSPDLVDDIVRQFAGNDVRVVVGIGGGSALDAAKAIAGLLRSGQSVMNYLEGVGPELDYEGPAVPLIAVPTTAGTGSEATRNAVLGRHGKDGFKKSFRDVQLVAERVIVDPALLVSCPPAVVAANGMDALTQLLESCVSLRANRLMSTLAEDGLRAVRDGLVLWFDQGAQAEEAQGLMAYAALLSGITLAHVGLGSVHGLAAPLGACSSIPHGVACGRLLAVATEINIRAMREREPDNAALAVYVRCAELLLQRHFRQPEHGWQALIELLHEWTRHLELPGLAHYGLTVPALDDVVANARGTSMKTNPIVLTDAELKELLQRCL